MVAFIHSVNNAVAKSPIGTWFQLDGSKARLPRHGATFLTDVRAGITTWASMAYIIAVNAAILADSGGTCECPGTAADPICLADEAYAACKEVTRRDLIITTAAISCLASSLMGFFANLPVGLAPGLGLNAYLAYSQVGFNGSGTITYREAMAAVFLEGWIFMILSILGVRVWLARLLPRSLVLSMGAGIGLFIALIGLSPSNLSVTGIDNATIIGLGGCREQYRDPDVPNRCLSHVLQLPTMWLGIFLGGIVTVFMMMYRIKGAIIIGIFLVSVVSWPRGTPVSYFPHTPAGDNAFDFFKQVVDFHPLERMAGVFDFSGLRRGHTWIALITFLYVDLFDTTGTLYAMAKYAKLVNPKTGDFERSTAAYCVDGFCISMGATMGSSPVTTFVESATGISEGGKTGIAGITTGICFFISIFFAPIFASIPGYATGGALVIVGALMIRNVAEVNWSYMGDAVPAFLTLAIIPFTYNIAYGVITGIITYILLNGSAYLLTRISPKLAPAGYYDVRDPWVYPEGGVTPMWMRRLRRGDKTPWLPKEGDMDYISADDHFAVAEIERDDSLGKAEGEEYPVGTESGDEKRMREKEDIGRLEKDIGRGDSKVHSA